MSNSKTRREGGSWWFKQLELPAALSAALTREARALDVAVMKEEAEEQEAVLIKQAIEPGVLQAPPLPSSPDKARLAGHGPLVDLFEPGVVDAAHGKMTKVGVGDKAWQTQRVKLIQHVADRGSRRRLHRPRQWNKSLAALRAAHANFDAVLTLIEEELVLAGPKRELVLPPILLNGPPGCGKTFFAQHLADLFETGFVRVSMETAQTSAQLSGTAAQWGNTKPGLLFDQLVDGDFANPVFLLDEIDKAGGYESHRADKALYGLLERKSAEQWSDTSMPELVMNASHVIWLLTSNDARQIPEPLRSRMRQFDIEPLDAHDARQLVRTLYREEACRYPHLKLNPELPIAHCDVLRCHSPRVIVRLVHSLVARLAKQARKDVTLDDLVATGALGDRLVELDRWFDKCMFAGPTH